MRSLFIVAIVGVFCFICGIIAERAVVKIRTDSEIKGFLIVIPDSEEGTYLFLESSVPFEELIKEDTVKFGVKLRTPRKNQPL